MMQLLDGESSGNPEDYFIGQADIKLARAGDLAEGWDRANGIDGLIERLEELRCDINSERRKLCGNR